MRSVQDIRRTLESRAGEVPDGLAVVHRAQARAAQLRRRRRITQGVAAAAAVVLVAVGAPLAVRHDGVSEPPASPAAPYRTPSQLTLNLAPGSGFVLISRGGDANRQFAHVRDARALGAARPDQVGGNEGADVWAFDPGTYDPTALQRGEPVTVSGRPAWYVGDLAFSPANSEVTEGGPAVGWQVDPGVWVIVYEHRLQPRSRADLLEVARQIRVGPPREAGMPVQFGWIPDDLPVSYVALTDQPGLAPHAHLGFGPGRRVTPGTAPTDLLLSVMALPHAGTEASTSRGLPAPTRVGGHDTWYLPRPNQRFSGAPTGADMIVRTDRCTVYLHTVDRSRVTAGDFTRLVGNATFGDCTDPAGWLPPVR